MLEIPKTQAKILAFANELISRCTNSQGNRAAYYQQLDAVARTGTVTGAVSLVNLLHDHLDRLASHLFSPTDLRFTLDFENEYPAEVLKRANLVARLITRDWDRNNTDILFARGVLESLKYGAALLKQWVELDSGNQPLFRRRLVLPWQFGVYREDENDLSNQEAMVETTFVSLPEVWQRIYAMPDAADLFESIKATADDGGKSNNNESYMQQVVSTSQIDTTGGTNSLPGGVVQFGATSNPSGFPPQPNVPMVKLHELWVKGQDDYVTIQVIEDSILVAPRFKPTNALIPMAVGESGPRVHPYTLIQPNEVEKNFWGRSELVDLIMPQDFLSATASDIKRLFQLQVDKIFGFTGFDGIDDEMYGAMRVSGFLNLPQGASVQDLTPKLPPESMAILDKIIALMNMIGGFPDIMQGRGEPGVRAGSHANTLLKTGSPRLRDRSLLVERQCAMAADLTLTLKEAKDAHTYWTDGTTEEAMKTTSFLLTDLPPDWRVTVDSHSSSPIFMDNHEQKITFGLGKGLIDGETAIEMLRYPNSDLLIRKLKQRQEAAQKEKAELMKQHPEIAEKVAEKTAVKQATGGSHR